MVHLRKPAHLREEAITDKTGGGNRDAECMGKNAVRRAARNTGQRKVTGGADFHAKPIQLSGMGKGSVPVQGVAPKGSNAV